MKKAVQFHSPILLAVLLFITISLFIAAPLAAQTAVPLNWWDAERNFRVPLTVEPTAVFIDKVVAVEVNFGALLQQSGEQRPFNPDSLHLVEVDAADQQLATDVAYQLELATAQQGTLYFVVAGKTAVSTPRYFHLYFDVAQVTPRIVTPQVVVTAGVIDEEQEGLQIETQGGTYYYQNQGAGFSSLVDAAGNDWIDYHPTGGSAGNYRGLPNFVFPEGHFHPGATTGISTLLSQGALRAVVEATTDDGLWTVRYIFYPTYIEIEMVTMPKPYWFLYEGTPGGTLDLDTDLVVYSDGTELTAGQVRNEDIPGEEWVYFADPTNGRSLFLVNHAPDDIVDTYWPLDGVMTVFGFGREQTSLEPRLDTPRKFSVGLVDSTDFATLSELIHSATTELTATVGTPSQRFRLSLPFVRRPQAVRFWLFGH